MQAHPQTRPLDAEALNGGLSAGQLHKLHLASLGGDGQTMEPACALALSASFGCVERWHEAFTAGAKAQAGNPGWMLLAFQPHEGTLVNHWLAEQKPARVDGVPILVLHMQDHDGHPDAGAAAVAGVDAFMNHIHWAAVYARYQHAVHAASETCGTTADEVGEAVVIDVRRAGVFEQAGSVIPGARWRDPATVGTWAAEWPTDHDVVVYCVHGHEVSRSTALRLRAAGLNARYLRGGIDGWQTDGRPTQNKGAAS